MNTHSNGDSPQVLLSPIGIPFKDYPTLFSSYEILNNDDEDICILIYADVNEGACDKNMEISVLGYEYFSVTKEANFQMECDLEIPKIEKGPMIGANFPIFEISSSSRKVNIERLNSDIFNDNSSNLRHVIIMTFDNVIEIVCKEISIQQR